MQSNADRAALDVPIDLIAQEEVEAEEEELGVSSGDIPAGQQLVGQKRMRTAAASNDNDSSIDTGSEAEDEDEETEPSTEEARIIIEQIRAVQAFRRTEIRGQRNRVAWTMEETNLLIRLHALYAKDGESR